MSEPTTRFVVGRGDGGKRLDRFLHEKIPGLSRTRIQAAIRERVTLSWEVTARPSTSVRPGGEVRIGYTPLPEELLRIELPVLARGSHWLAVDKPAGIVVHPVNRIRENSLIRILRRQEGQEQLRLVHRLDRETSGVLLVADGSAAASALSRAFFRGSVRKEYLAFVRGAIEGERGRIELPIGDDESSTIYVKRAISRKGQPARTDWTVEERHDAGTLLRLSPSTGRRHQLRVHLAAVGHPILGDILYGRSDEAYLRMARGEGDERRDDGGPRRQLLHCARLVFPDPDGAGEVEVVAPLPEGFAPG